MQTETYSRSQFVSLTGAFDFDKFSMLIKEGIPSIAGKTLGIAMKTVGSDFNVIFSFASALTQQERLAIQSVVSTYAGERSQTEMERTKEEAKRQIDLIASETRERYMTVGAGQEAVYILKYLDAKQYAAAGYPADLSLYPFVKAESEATAMTPREAANTLLYIAGRWAIIAATIEKIRIGHKRQVDQATRYEDIRRVLTEAVVALKKV